MAGLKYLFVAGVVAVVVGSCDLAGLDRIDAPESNWFKNVTLEVFEFNLFSSLILLLLPALAMLFCLFKFFNAEYSFVKLIEDESKEAP